jgi:hydroxymethylglutaryl-CoA reductase (NADPH)
VWPRCRSGWPAPLLVNGERARGEFLIPLATTEGTLVASYNRGMKAINLAGGVTCTVVDDRMQRAPVFEFDDARQSRDFCHWVNDHQAEIAAVAESTTSIGKLVEIECYLASRLAFLRFDFTTGDAAGQNMVGRATFAACSWILERMPTVRRFWLEANFATDKKASHVNMMRTRGKRVTAEVTLPRAVLARVLRVSPEGLHEHANVANIGSFLSGANNNGLHAANAIAAMFIATGQDAANVAESSAAVVHTEVTSGGDFYVSITLPSLILATHGGGTGLPTQRECLEILGCTERGSVGKLAEIVAGTVLAGRDLAGLRDLVARLGVESRAVRPQPLMGLDGPPCTLTTHRRNAPGDRTRIHPGDQHRRSGPRDAARPLEHPPTPTPTERSSP